MSAVTIRGKDGLLHRGLHNHKAGLVAYSLGGQVLYVSASEIVRESAGDDVGRAVQPNQLTNPAGGQRVRTASGQLTQAELPSILRRQAM